MACHKSECFLLSFLQDGIIWFHRPVRYRAEGISVGMRIQVRWRVEEICVLRIIGIRNTERSKQVFGREYRAARGGSFVIVGRRATT